MATTQREKAARLGVRRVSVASGPMRATLALVREVARALRGPGTCATFTRSASRSTR